MSEKSSGLGNCAALLSLVLGASCAASAEERFEIDDAQLDVGDVHISAILEDLFEKMKGEDWPARPWLWADVTREVAVDTTLQLGIKASFLGVEAGTTVSTRFELGHKTQVIFVTTQIRDNQAMTKRTKEGVYFAPEGDTAIVATCIYASWLSTTDRVAASLLIQGNGVMGGAQLRSTINRQTNSQFFRVDPDKTPSYYLNDVCETHYQEKIRSAVQTDLANLAYDVLVYSNPKDTCLPPDADQPRNPAGDPSCKEWHSQILPGLIESTVPRCNPDANGNYSCMLRGKADNACPLYQDADENVSAFPKPDNWLITRGAFEYFCDRDLGLACVQVKEVGWFNHAEGSCQKPTSQTR